MNYNCQKDFRTSLVAMSERQSGIGKHYNYGGSKRRRFMHMEVNRIATIVWAIMKRIRISLEDENDDSNKAIFYTLPQSLSKKISIKLEDYMFQDRSKRQSKTLLGYHKVIVKPLINPQCAPLCVSSKSKRMPTTYIVCHFYTLLSVRHS